MKNVKTYSEFINENQLNESKLRPRNVEGRQEKAAAADYQRVLEYIRKGSKGDLDLADSAIASLPANLKVGGALYLNNTKITSLPANLKVGSDLDLADSAIASLPANLKVGGDLYIHSTKITSLPANLKVDGHIFKNF